MANDYDREWEKRGERAYGTFTRHPILSSLGGFGALVALFVVIGLISLVGHFALGWFNKAADVAGPENVSTQYAKVIEDWNSLEAEAINACGAEDVASQSGDPTLLEDPAFAYKAQFRRTAVDFNRRQQNIFEAKIVGPSGYPQTAPSLEVMQAKVC